MKIHNPYGRGVFESAYEEPMSYEPAKQHLTLKSKSPIPLIHELINKEAGFRAYKMTEDKVLIEIKSFETWSRCLTSKELPAYN